VNSGARRPDDLPRMAKIITFWSDIRRRESSQPYRRYQCGGGPEFRYGIHARPRPRIDSKLCARGSQPDLSAGMDAFFRNRSRGARIHHRCRAPGDGANASGHLVRLRGALSAEIMRASVWSSFRVMPFPTVGALTADRVLERSGMGASGRIECCPRSR